MTHTIHHVDVDRDGWTETFVTVPLTEPVADAVAAQAVFAALAEHLADRGVQVLQEKVYGRSATMDALLEARRAAYDARNVPVAPVTFLDGRPCVGGVFAGVQIIGAIPRTSEVTCRTAEHAGAAVGRLLETPTYRTLYLAGVSGRPTARSEASSVTEQGTRMFAAGKGLLEASGFGVHDIVRTWIYLPRLLDWYGEFNRVRTASFKQWGLIREDGSGVLPASTGIQCRRHANEECFMDVYALARRDGGRQGIEPMRNTRQNEAYEYGSSFSRGMNVSLDGPTVHYVSGTASINPCGETVYHGDHQGQLVETLYDIHALLRNSGAAFKDVCQAVAYCKGEEDYAQFRRFLDIVDWQDMPAISVYADVCRDELLFEMDAIAVRRP